VAMAIIDRSNPITDKDVIKYIQEVIGVFLYYARAVDYTMITTVNKLASRQANPTEDLLSAIDHFLQYASSNSAAEVIYYPSSMKLITHSDASYLSESKARSRGGDSSSFPDWILMMKYWCCRYYLPNNSIRGRICSRGRVCCPLSQRTECYNIVKYP
jgi:hypothetical protein